MQNICLEDSQKKPKGDMWTYAYKNAKILANTEQNLCKVMHVRFKYTEDKYVTEKCGNQYFLMKHFQDFFLKLHDKSFRGVGHTKSVKFDDYPALHKCINKAEEYLKQNSDWFEKRYKKKTDTHNAGLSTLRDEHVSQDMNNSKTSASLHETIISNGENRERKAVNKPNDYNLNMPEMFKQLSTSSPQSDMSIPPAYKDFENPSMATSFPEGVMLAEYPSDPNIHSKSSPFRSPFQSDNLAYINDSPNNNDVQMNMYNTFTPPTVGTEDTISCTSSEVRHELDNFNDSHDEFDFALFRNGNIILQNPAYPVL